MKNYLMFLSMIFVGFGCAHCSKSSPSPVPVPVTSFSIAGKNILVNGQLKPGAKVGVEHAKAAVGVSVGVLEK